MIDLNTCYIKADATVTKDLKFMEYLDPYRCDTPMPDWYLLQGSGCAIPTWTKPNDRREVVLIDRKFYYKIPPLETITSVIYRYVDPLGYVHINTLEGEAVRENYSKLQTLSDVELEFKRDRHAETRARLKEWAAEGYQVALYMGLMGPNDWVEVVNPEYKLTQNNSYKVVAYEIDWLKVWEDTKGFDVGGFGGEGVLTIKAVTVCGKLVTLRGNLIEPKLKYTLRSHALKDKWLKEIKCCKS